MPARMVIVERCFFGGDLCVGSDFDGGMRKMNKAVVCVLYRE